MISDRDFFRNFGFALEIEQSNQIFLSKKTTNRNFLVPTSKFWKYLAIAPAVFVSFHPRTACSLVATFFRRQHWSR